ncbi:hypothetical protein K7432_003419 [Basidiobolus ranarum]|uniref:SLC26A/SulP transporter domain-containing protein n=1 Tax=Basidiobolus ranarum TaxID=34480 RepID=A0ABR2W690_9FUNG
MVRRWRRSEVSEPLPIYSRVKRWVPLLEWLPKYNWKLDFTYDLVAGLTYSTVVIPQSMAYAMLAKLPPVYGLYSSIMPIFLYSVFGTSRHLVGGTFALISMMLGEAVTSIVRTRVDSNMEEYEEEFLRTTLRVTFLVGVIQILFSFMNIGKYITKYLLPDPLVSGFTNAAAIYIVTSQFQNLFGIQVPEYNGVFSLVKTWGYVISRIQHVDMATFLLGSISIVSILFLRALESKVREWLNRFQNNQEIDDETRPFLEVPVTSQVSNTKNTLNENGSTGIKLPLPDILLVIIFYTTVTWLFRLDQKFNISVIGYIPSGFPSPTNPVHFQDIPDILIHLKESFLLAIIAYVMTISIGKNFAKKDGYQVDGNQEMFALGISTAISSFFSSYVSCGSLTRTSVIHTSGGKSQISAFIGTLVVCGILLSLTSLFYYLPKAVLAGVILMACKSLFLQLSEVTAYWKHNRTQFFIWLITFIAAITVKAEFGIAVGMVVSIIGLILETLYKSQTPL